MALFCSCSHNRLDHVGGNEISDRRILKCESAGCHCSKYHPSKDNDDSYVYKSLAIALVVGLIGVGGFVAICVSIDILLENYTIEKIPLSTKTFLVYENGTRVNDKDLPDSIDVVSMLKFAIGMVIFFMFYILAALFIDPVYSRAKLKVINSK